MRKINTLLIDDNEMYCDVFNEHLKRLKDFECNNLVAYTLQQGKTIIDNNNIELVFLDLDLGDGRNDTLFGIYYLKALFPNIHILVITGGC